MDRSGEPAAGTPAGRTTDAPAARSWSELMRDCASVLDQQGIELGDELNLAELVAQLEKLRGRRIHLTPIRGPVGEATLYGVTISTPTVDSIYFVDSHSEIQSLHGILHELAHLILGHRHASASANSPAEQQAEAMAAVLRGRWREPAPARWVVSRTVQTGVDRLDAAMRRPAACWCAALMTSASVAGALAPSGMTGMSSPLLAVLSLMLATAAATAAAVVARSASDSTMTASIPVVPLGCAVLLGQLVLFSQAHLAGALADPTAPRPHETHLVAIAAITSIWCFVAAALLSATIWAYRGFLHLHPRTQLSAALLGVAGCVAVLGGAALLPWGAPPAQTVASEVGHVLVLVAGGLVVVGFVVPSVAALLAPLRRTLRTWRSLRRMTRLRRYLQRGVPGWSQELPSPRPGELLFSPQRAETRLYQQIVAVRDLTWTLLAAVDLTVIDGAVEAADRACRARGEPAVAAAAEACWLAHALRQDTTPCESNDVVIREDRPPPGSSTPGDGELAFLLDVERLWNGAIVRRYLRDLSRPDTATSAARPTGEQGSPTTASS